MRKVTGIEMLGVYAALLFLPVAFLMWWRRVELWVVTIFNVSLALCCALAIPNVGALYRFRYGYLMTLVALGLAGFMVRKEGLRKLKSWWRGLKDWYFTKRRKRDSGSSETSEERSAESLVSAS